MKPAAEFFEQTQILVLTATAFGVGHLLSGSGEGEWWHKTWAVKSGSDVIVREWNRCDQKEVPVKCLLYLDRIDIISPDPAPEFLWIRDAIARAQLGIHVGAELVHECWFDNVERTRYPWRLRITGTEDSPHT